MFRLGENCPFDYCDTYLTELSLFVAKATSSLYYLPKENLRFVTFSKMSDDDSVHKAETRERRQNRNCVFVKQGHCGVPYSRCGAQCHGSLSLHIPLMRDDLTFSVGHKQIQAVAKLPILFWLPRFVTINILFNLSNSSTGSRSWDTESNFKDRRAQIQLSEYFLINNGSKIKMPHICNHWETIYSSPLLAEEESALCLHIAAWSLGDLGIIVQHHQGTPNILLP